ncbi:vWA domain-containing protein [Roseiconus lacunae]|uniref:VWA domain-containing protein n=1 Tax=Roseiconus lacunae TaxID=2605694 RepID=A0ABT7PLI7_9BACT|nr:vWA domain-containing protein [Roseiconus lacunae]MCD0460876.1 VWA domain-containing protein [Roseiconus lacunae]MDM4017368.1 vWA domain-containing protein [Roseiconus lacunae]WRQ48721.1 vWA domain-containing protein [Stieleria sp. HD01]
MHNTFTTSPKHRQHLRPRQNTKQNPRQRRGAMLVLILFMMVGFIAAVAFSVDIAHMHLSRTELRSATDAAAQAASQELSDTFDRAAAIRKGQEIAALNLVNGDPLLLDGADFQFGRSDENADGRFVFSEGTTPLNTVRVTGRRTSGSPSGPIPLFFGNVMGFSSFEPQSVAAATYIERDVVLVVDRSGSMSGRKFSDLQAAIGVFIATLQTTPVDEEVGLASYAATATEDVQLTNNLFDIQSGLASLRPSGLTSISRGMEAGSSIMSRSRSSDFVERTLIVMTDGLHNRGPEPRGVATRLAADDVRIHTITFGNGADQARMREIATIGGGKHFHALSAAELTEAYREIALTLGTVVTE